MRSCLITGASGFIGRHLLDHLRQTGDYDRIYMLDVLPPVSVPTGAEFVPADLRVPFTLNLPDHCDTCFHLAAVCKEPGYAWDEYYAVNHVGTRNLCSAIGRSAIRNIVFTSTMMVYRAGEQRMDEVSLTCPDTAYGISKLLAEEVLHQWAAVGPGRRLRIVRPGVVFGLGDKGNFTRLFRALRSRYFVYIGRRTTVKGSIYVKDLVRCLEFLSTDDKAELVYNAVFPQPYTIEDIAREIQDIYGMKGTPPTVPYLPALAAAHIMEFAAALGLHNPVHHRRIEKLYHSTHLSAQRLCDAGFRFQFDLRTALEDWKSSCVANELC